MKIEDGRYYIIADGRKLRAEKDKNGYFRMYSDDEFDNYICDVFQDGKSVSELREYNIVEEILPKRVKRVYLDEINNKTYDSLSSLERERNQSTYKQILIDAIDCSFEGDEDIDLTSFINFLSLSTNKKEVLKFLEDCVL